MTNEPKLAPSVPENASVAQPAATPHEKPQEKAAPAAAPVNGAPEPKKAV